MKFSSFVGEPLELPQTVPSTRRVMQLLLLRREQHPQPAPTNRILTLVAEELVSFYAESDFLISLNPTPVNQTSLQTQKTHYFFQTLQQNHPRPKTPEWSQSSSIQTSDRSPQLPEPGPCTVGAPQPHHYLVQLCLEVHQGWIQSNRSSGPLSSHSGYVDLP